MLSEEFLIRLETLRLRMRNPAAGNTGGLRRSKALGTSVEFSDFREYTMGDDLRRVDWNAYARFDKLFVKLFMEEQEAKIHLVLDASGSMGFGEPSKWETAVKLAEALSYLTLCGGDTISLTALHGDSILSTRPLNGRSNFIEAVDFLEGLVPAGNTDLGTVIKKMSMATGRGITIFLSDFLSPGGYETALEYLRYRKQEITAIQILTAEEKEPDFEDAVQLVDAETGEVIEIMASYETLKAFHTALADFIDGLRSFCHQRGIAYVSLQTEDSLEGTMLRELSRIGLLT